VLYLLPSAVDLLLYKGAEAEQRQVALPFTVSALCTQQMEWKYGMIPEQNRERSRDVTPNFAVAVLT
jgi:hypothetical protein